MINFISDKLLAGLLVAVDEFYIPLQDLEHTTVINII